MAAKTNTSRDGQLTRLLRRVEKGPFPEDGLNRMVLKVAQEANQEYSSQIQFLLDHGYTEQDVARMIDRARQDGYIKRRVLGEQTENVRFLNVWVEKQVNRED